MRDINLIVVHCSATRVNQNFTVEQLEACHKARGFDTIGYHYYITKDGTLYPCRPERIAGAHARHYNAHSICSFPQSSSIQTCTCLLSTLS